jgi:hypothetical protein
LAAADEVTARRRRAVRAAELAVERAHYTAQRAERAFLACEPENRLVARSLETRWETALAELAEANAALATQSQAQPELPSPEQLAATVADLPALWAAETTSDKDRKRLLRTLLADVTITPSETDPTQLAMGLRWNPAPPASSRSPAGATPSSCAPPTPPRSRSPSASAPAWTTPPWPPHSTRPGTAPAPGSPSTVSPPEICATTTTSPTRACSARAS